MPAEGKPAQPVRRLSVSPTFHGSYTSYAARGVVDELLSSTRPRIRHGRVREHCVGAERRSRYRSATGRAANCTPSLT
ncbi:hypothetical protein BAUCODRAFT_122549 [Baudoinia panamericana UAMH 10762]|uniref:Uncharacterized protein n=1 Tax=Baudoinia panamericana (strain UAMH 10762) TaxID=717646 RepID=M2NCE6_BAUPA|nr:uncharacterized protein BAUCODRAFT_122549 [Baudoinia panamericana UAMH 10762]EMC96555.1 hypothetical protein BAUCODRAFT_122549 [Baudoinia panamericana UAMH 10762]